MFFFCAVLIALYVLKLPMPKFRISLFNFVVVFNPVRCLNNFNYCGPPFSGLFLLFFLKKKIKSEKSVLYSYSNAHKLVHLSPKIIHQIAVWSSTCNRAAVGSCRTMHRTASHSHFPIINAFEAHQEVLRIYECTARSVSFTLVQINWNALANTHTHTGRADDVVYCART